MQKKAEETFHRRGCSEASTHTQRQAGVRCQRLSGGRPLKPRRGRTAHLSGRPKPKPPPRARRALAGAGEPITHPFLVGMSKATMSWKTVGQFLKKYHMAPNYPPGCRSGNLCSHKNLCTRAQPPDSQQAQGACALDALEWRGRKGGPSAPRNAAQR